MTESFNPLKAIGAAISRIGASRHERKMDAIAAQGVTHVTLTNRRGDFPEVVELSSWNSVYESYIKSGLSPEQAKIETDKRVWILG